MMPHLVVMAKQPVPGRVKTRLCPPCTHRQAAAIAEAALLDTLDAVSRCAADGRTLAISGWYPAPAGWAVLPQRGEGLGERLANAFADAPAEGRGVLLIGMDTPQVAPQLLALVGRALDRADAVLGPAVDGGWWILGLREPHHARALSAVPMSTAQTGRRTEAALRERGLSVVRVPTLRDVDTAALAASPRLPKGVHPSVGVALIGLAWLGFAAGALLVRRTPQRPAIPSSPGWSRTPGHRLQ